MPGLQSGSGALRARPLARADETRVALKAVRLALARTLFNAGLWKLGGLALPEGGVLFLKGGEMMVFRHNGRLETRKGTRV